MGQKKKRERVLGMTTTAKLEGRRRGSPFQYLRLNPTTQGVEIKTTYVPIERKIATRQDGDKMSQFPKQKKPISNNRRMTLSYMYIHNTYRGVANETGCRR